MNVTDLTSGVLKEASWNSNSMTEPQLHRLKESIRRYGVVQNLVVRPILGGCFEVLSGNQRLKVLLELGLTRVPCVIVDLDDSQARLLAEALNHVHGQDELGLRADAIRVILKTIPVEKVLSVLPETLQNLNALVSLGQDEIGSYLAKWQDARAARLKHMQFQLTSSQLEVVESALARLTTRAADLKGGSPNVRGTALYLLCKSYLEKETSL